MQINRKSLRKSLWMLVAGAALCSYSSAFADMSREDYLSALKIADQHVQKQKARSSSHSRVGSTSEALSASVIKGLYGRYYKVGDAWDVAASYIAPVEMRMTSDPEMLKAKDARVGVFHYEVTDVTSGSQPEVTLKITQRPDLGAVIMDPKVDAIILKWSDRMKQIDKSYLMRGRSQLIHVSPDGIRSPLSGLELFPLDVPDVITADTGTQPHAFPEIPAAVARIAQNAGYHPDLSKCSMYEQNDFFGRPVQILWQQGDPWPAYMKTAHGVAILVRKGEQ